MFDTPVSDIQDGVTVTGSQGGNGSITGTLKWLSSGPIADYWGAGNFIALQFETGDTDAVVKVGLDPSEGSGLVQLDDDMNGVFKVTDKDTQVFVIETEADGMTLRQEFDLSGLTCEAAENSEA